MSEAQRLRGARRCRERWHLHGVPGSWNGAASGTRRACGFPGGNDPQHFTGGNHLSDSLIVSLEGIAPPIPSRDRSHAALPWRESMEGMGHMIPSRKAQEGQGGHASLHEFGRTCGCRVPRAGTRRKRGRVEKLSGCISLARRRGCRRGHGRAWAASRGSWVLAGAATGTGTAVWVRRGRGRRRHANEGWVVVEGATSCAAGGPQM